jgi:PST family polysaccharide transporter
LSSPSDNQPDFVEAVDPSGVIEAEVEAAATGAPVLRNARVLLVAEILVRGLGFVTSIVVARAVTPEVLGEVAIAQTTAQFLGQIGDGGLTLWTQRQILLNRDRVSALAMETTLVQLLLSAAVVGLLLIVAVSGVFTPGASRLLILFAPFAIGQALSLLYVLQALDEMASAAFVKGSTSVITAVAAIALVVTTHNPDWVAITLWSGQLAGDALGFWILRRRHGLMLSSVSPGNTRRLLVVGLPFLGALVLAHYALIIDTVTLGLLSTSRALGEYAPPSRLAATALLMFLVLVTAAYPAMMRLFSTDRAEFRALMDALVRLAMRLTLPLTALAAVEATPLIELIYGPKYHDGAHLLTLLALTVPLGWFGFTVGHSLIVAGRQNRYFLAIAIQCVVATVAFPLLVSSDGSTGAAIAEVISWLAFAFAFLWAASPLLGWQPLRGAVGELSFGVVPAAALLLLRSVIGDSLLYAVPVWVASVAAVEWLRGMPTTKGMQELRQGPTSPA